MTQEEKQSLLFKDICAKLPYGLKVNFTSIDHICAVIGVVISHCHPEVELDYGPIILLKHIKPYLRPMSSMTEEEEESFREDTGLDIFKCTVNKELEDLWTTDCSVKDLFCLYSWLNEHHFDYNGLIEMGLALEAPADMYKTE